jgi:hypothetical protein
MTEREAIRKALDKNPERAAAMRRMAAEGKIVPYTGPTPGKPLVIVASSSHFGITGSKQARCGCGAIVWLSPSTQAMQLGDPEAKVICTACLVKLLSRKEAHA